MIAVIGTGRMGGALGTRLAEMGKDVVFGSRDPDGQTAGALALKTGAKACSIADAAAQADTICIATPYAANEAVLADLGDCEGKLIIDITNALGMGEGGLMAIVSDTSSGQEIQAAKPGAKVVKALNTIGFHVVAKPAAAGGAVTAMLAGDDDGAKATVAALMAELGFEAVDVGPIRHARYLEGMSALYLVPYLTGNMAGAFEYYLRRGASPTDSKGVRAAG